MTIDTDSLFWQFSRKEDGKVLVEAFKPIFWFEVDAKEATQIASTLEEFVRVGEDVSSVVPVSKCCGASVIVYGQTTHYYVCTKCRQPCDAKFAVEG